MPASSTLGSRKDRQTHWRDMIARQTASGLSVAAFCRKESIATPTFYLWRKRIAGNDCTTLHAKARATPSFIELDPMRESTPASAGIDIRLDLPGGITLTLTRR